MKKPFLLIIFCVCIPVWSFDLGIAADLGTAQDPLLWHESVRIEADIRSSFAGDFELRLPVSVVLGEEVTFLDAAVQVVYYPWSKGLYLGLDAFRAGYSLTESIGGQKYFNLNEVTVGWTFRLWRGLLIEPSVSFRDPSGAYSDEYSALLGAMPGYRFFRGKVMLGYKFEFGGEK